MQPRDAQSTQSAANPNVAIIIVSYNSESVLPGLLDSLPAGLEGIDNYETIVVDNDSHDRSVDVARAHKIKPTIITMGRNAGYAAGINAGAAVAGPDANLLILNPDLRLHPHGGSLLIAELLSDPSAGIAVPQIVNMDGSLSWSIRREPSVLTAWAEAILGGKLAGRLGLGEMVGAPEAYNQERRIDWATGAILAISAKARRLVGSWDETFFLYMEEVDYMRRVRESGYSVVYVPRAKAMHVGGEYRENPHLYGLLTTNRIRYHQRSHGPISTFAFRLSILLGEGVRTVRGLPGHRAAVRAALKEPLFTNTTKTDPSPPFRQPGSQNQ